eukprot:403350854
MGNECCYSTRQKLYGRAYYQQNAYDPLDMSNNRSVSGLITTTSKKLGFLRKAPLSDDNLMLDFSGSNQKTLRVQDNSYVTPFDDSAPSTQMRKSGIVGLNIHESQIQLQVSQTREDIIDQLSVLWTLKQKEKEQTFTQIFEDQQRRRKRQQQVQQESGQDGLQHNQSTKKSSDSRKPKYFLADIQQRKVSRDEERTSSFKERKKLIQSQRRFSKIKMMLAEKTRLSSNQDQEEDKNPQAKHTIKEQDTLKPQDVHPVNLETPNTKKSQRGVDFLDKFENTYNLRYDKNQNVQYTPLDIMKQKKTQMNEKNGKFNVSQFNSEKCININHMEQPSQNYKHHSESMKHIDQQQEEYDQLESDSSYMSKQFEQNLRKLTHREQTKQKKASQKSHHNAPSNSTQSSSDQQSQNTGHSQSFKSSEGVEKQNSQKSQRISRKNQKSIRHQDYPEQNQKSDSNESENSINLCTNIEPVSEQDEILIRKMQLQKAQNFLSDSKVAYMNTIQQIKQNSKPKNKVKFIN